jgi:hypothetical protein
MHSGEQYLERVREEYGKASRREKTRLLNEAPVQHHDARVAHHHDPEADRDLHD